MERQEPQGEENGDPAFAHVPRMPTGPLGQHLPQAIRGGTTQAVGPGINHPTTTTHSYLPGQQQILQSSTGGPHQSQLSSSSKESNSSSFPTAQKQMAQVSSVPLSVPQSSNMAVSGGGPQQGLIKGKDAHQIKLQQLQSQQQQLLIAAAAVASSSAAQSNPISSALSSGQSMN